MEPLVLPFSELSRASLPIAGGKAASLGDMTRAGFPVPPGFCVTTAAYRLAAGQSGLGAVLAELEGVPATELPALSALAARAREALIAAPVPEPVRAACAEAYRAIGGDAPVAVRSSATAEDLPDASFAGQHETLLNVVGEQALLDAVRECWSSLFTERAVVYRAQRGIQHGAVHLAVAVQRMVDAAVAGVMFTANPVTGRRTEVVIDASPGLGEAIVSGAVNPDHFVLAREGRKVLERRLGDKKLRIESVQGGGTREVHVEGGAAGACVTDAELAALCELGERMEAHAGSPQDLEWALDRARRPLLLQSRPITTLYPIPPGPPSPPPDQATRAYFSFNVAQGVFGPFTRMGQQAFRLVTAGMATFAGFPPADVLAGSRLLQISGERLWLDASEALRSDVGRVLFQFGVARMEARTVPAVTLLLQDPRFAPRRSPRAAVLRALARLQVRLKVPVGAILGLLAPARARARAHRRIDEHLRLGDVPASAGPTERVEAFVRLLFNLPRVLGAVGPTAGIGMAGIAVARKLLGPLASREEMDGVLRALPYNPTTEMDLELWGVADEIARAPDPEARKVFAEQSPQELSRRYRERRLPAAAQAAMDRFLQRWGVRAVAEIDLGVPRWRDDPAHLMGSVANYLNLRERPGAVPPDEQFRRAEREAEAMVKVLVDRAERAGEWKGTLVSFVLSRVRALAGLRELIKFGAGAGDRARAGVDPGGGRGAGEGRAAGEGRGRGVPGPGGGEARAGGLRLRLRRGPARAGARAPRRPRARAGAAPHPPADALRRHGRGVHAPRPRRPVGHSRLRRPRHRHGAGGDGPHRGQARPGGDPGRPVHRPGLDAVVPHRRRAGDGDGRRDVARRGGGARVRHPRGGGRDERHPAHQDRPEDHRGRERRGGLRVAGRPVAGPPGLPGLPPAPASGQNWMR